MSNSTPQGPGPEFGSAPDATPLDETAAVEAAMDEEVAELDREGADDVIDISDPEGPELTADVDDIDAG
jgi:hypothetical protein